MRLRFNPFVPNETADAERFEGRKDELQKILTALNQTRFGSAVHLMVLGERGIGKSSLLAYGEELARDEADIDGQRFGFNFLTVPMDLAGATSHQSITRRAARNLRERLRPYEAAKDGIRQVVKFLLNWEVLGVKYDGKETDLDADEALDALIDQLLLIERSGVFDGVCYLIDEADDPPIEARLATWCKSLTERYKAKKGRKLSVILAGQLSLRDKLHADHESALRIFSPIVLTVLSDVERTEAIDAGLAYGKKTSGIETRMTDEAREALVRLSGGYPHFLQHYCYLAFEADEDDEISLEDVRASRAQAIAEIGDKFFLRSFLSEIGSDDYRRLLRFMAPKGAAFMPRKEMVDASGISEKVIDHALRSLTESGFLVRDETRAGWYRLQSEAFADWLEVYQPGEGLDG